RNGVSLRRHILPPSAANSIGPHKYASMRIGKDRNLKEWSGRWDSNPRLHLGKVPYYPYTTTAPEPQNFITTPLRRQDHTAVQRMARHPQRETHPWRAQLRTARNPVLCCLADLKHARCLNDGRLPLAFRKL